MQHSWITAKSKSLPAQPRTEIGEFGEGQVMQPASGGCQKELEKKDEEEATKVTRLVLMDLESKAVNRGMDAPVSDVDRPSTYCMGKVMGIPIHCT